MDNTRLSIILLSGCVFLLSSAIAIEANAQQIFGRVTAQDGLPLPFVNIAVPALEQGTVSDENGHFALEGLSSDTYQVVFSYIGYQQEVRVVVLADDDVRLNVTMKAIVLQNEEVLIQENAEDVLTRDIRSVSVLDALALEDIRGQTLGETLAELPGITTINAGPAIAKPVIRGLHSQRVVVLNSGVAQEGQQWGGEHAPEIDPFAPVRIEVIKGVAGVEYGIGAIGGVIRLEPEPLPVHPFAPISGRFSLNGFSNNGQGAASLFLEDASNRIAGLGWRVQGSFRKAGDARTPTVPISNSGFQENNGALTIGLERPKTSWMFQVSHFGTELGIFCGSHFGNLNDFYRAVGRDEPLCTRPFSYSIDAPKQRIAHDLATLKGTWRFESGDAIEAQYGIQRNHRQEFDSHRSGVGDVSTEQAAFDLTLLTHSLDLKLRHRPLGNMFGVAGISGTNQLNSNDASGFLIPNFRALTGGAFVRESWIRNNLTLEAGMRYDYRWIVAWPRERLSAGPFVRRTSAFSNVSGAVGAIWTFSEDWSLSLNAGSGWRPPSVNELYNFGVHHGTAQFEIGNPELETEQSIGTDLTLRKQGERLNLEVSGYANRFNGFIFLFPDQEEEILTIRGSFPVFRYLQADARLKGLDGRIELGIAPQIDFHLQGSLVRGDNLDINQPLIYMPADRLHAGLEWHVPVSGRLDELDLEVEHVQVARQKRFPEGDFLNPPAGYHLVNASLHAKFLLDHTAVRLNLSVNNLLNTGYRDYLSRFRYFVDDPGRTVVLRISIPIGLDTSNNQ